jgi:exonuclease VII large subunit
LNIQIDQMEIPTILIVQELKAARYFLKEYQKDHIQLREEHLKTLAEARILARKYSILQSKTARSLDKRIAKEIHRIKRKEALN